MLYNKRWEKETKQTWQMILLEAANLIEREGWTRGNYHDDYGYCVSGALRQIAQSVGPTTFLLHASLYEALEEAVINLGNYIDDDIIKWNDTIAESKEQVVRIMREVAN